MEITGTIIHIEDTKQVSDSFKKREFVIRTDEQYPQEIKLQFSQERCVFLHEVEINSQATVQFNLRGKSYQKDDVKNWFNTLEAWKIKVTTNAHNQEKTHHTNVHNQASSDAAASTIPAPTEEDDQPF